MKTLRTIGLGVGFWLVGMVVGTVVFSVPTLQQIGPVPYLSSNPAITIPLLVLWALLAVVVSRRRVSGSAHPVSEGVALGVTLLLVNVVADAAVVVVALKAGLAFYGYAGLWVAYSLLLLIPWVTGRNAARRHSAPHV